MTNIDIRFGEHLGIFPFLWLIDVQMHVLALCCAHLPVRMYAMVKVYVVLNMNMFYIWYLTQLFEY